MIEDQPEDSKAVLELVRIYLEKNDRSRLVDLKRTLERSRVRAKSASVKTAASPSSPR